MATCSTITRRPIGTWNYSTPLIGHVAKIWPGVLRGTMLARHLATYFKEKKLKNNNNNNS
jgi:hypothetical protein